MMKYVLLFRFLLLPVADTMYVYFSWDLNINTKYIQVLIQLKDTFASTFDFEVFDS